MDDWTESEALQRTVLEELASNPAVGDARIEPSAREGVVTLTGDVHDWAERAAVTDSVLHVRGVTRVVDHLHLVPHGGPDAQDEDIRLGLDRLLQGLSTFPPHAVRGHVEHGVVTLVGTLDWEFQRRTLVNLVGRLHGVRDVVDRIRLTPRPSAEDAAARVRRAFARNAAIDADHVQVHITGTAATLTGRVRSWGERVEAERATWASPYVSDVRNELVVTPD